MLADCISAMITHSCKVWRASLPKRSTSAESRRGLIARASSGGNSSSSISISGWSRGTRIDALGFRLAIRGRSSLERPRSGSPSEVEEDEEDIEAKCMRLLSTGCGTTGTGAAPCMSLETAVIIGLPTPLRVLTHKERPRLEVRTASFQSSGLSRVAGCVGGRNG